MKLALLLTASAASTMAAATTVTCPCKNPSWCHPLTAETAAAPSRRPEFFGFATVTGAASPWRYYDWDVVTTVAWNTDPQLMCYAHSRGVRVVLSAGGAELIPTTQRSRL